MCRRRWPTSSKKVAEALARLVAFWPERAGRRLVDELLELDERPSRSLFICTVRGSTLAPSATALFRIGRETRRSRTPGRRSRENSAKSRRNGRWTGSERMPVLERRAALGDRVPERLRVGGDRAEGDRARW